MTETVEDWEDPGYWLGLAEQLRAQAAVLVQMAERHEATAKLVLETAVLKGDLEP